MLTASAKTSLWQNLGICWQDCESGGDAISDTNERGSYVLWTER